MGVERSILQNEVFPAVRRALVDVGIVLFEVDLRWGVTRAEAESGAVLDICLSEIDRCRPWVLGLLGDRYGWIDPNAKSHLTTSERFLKLVAHSGTSATELELRHAIVDRPDDAPAPAALLYWRTDDPSASPFAALARDLTASGATIRAATPDLISFAAMVRDDLIALAKARLPVHPVLSPAQMRARCRIEEGRDTFVERPELILLRRQAAGPRGTFALIGSEGCGKTALLCALAREVGATGRTRLIAALAPGGFRNWVGAFKSVLAQLGDKGDAAAGPAALARRLAIALKAAAALTPLCVLIDDVDVDPARPDALAWLPEAIPGAVIIVAVRGGDREAAAARELGYAVTGLGPPDDRLARGIIERRLMIYGRRLDDRQLRRVLSQQRSARDHLIVSEELRQTPRFEDLDPAVEALSTMKSSASLAEWALSRIIRSRGPDAADLLLAIAVSEVGLADETLRELAVMAGHRGAPLDIRLLCDAIGTYAVETVGRTLLADAAFRAAVLGSRSAADQYRIRRAIVAACLAKLEAPGSAEEILAQTTALGDHAELTAMLTQPDFAEALMRRAPDAFGAAWTEAVARGAAPPEKTYDTWAGEQAPDRVALAAEFLVRRNTLQSAERLAQDALARAHADDARTRIRAHLVLARTEETHGRLEAAEGHCRAIAAASSESEALRALAAANGLRLAFLRDGAGALAGQVAGIRALAEDHPDGRALATVTLVEALADLETGDRRSARRRFQALKRMSLRDDDLAASAAAEAGLARLDLARGARTSAERRARTVEAIGETLGDARLILEGLAVRTAVAMDSVECFRTTLTLIAERRRRAEALDDAIGLIEADMDEAILMAGQPAARGLAVERARRAIARSRRLGLRRLETKVLHLLDNDTSATPGF